MKERRFVRELLESKQRIMVLSFVVGVAFLFLIIRLWHLQILSADDYHAMSENNRLRFVPVAASRGAILDRTGTVLVSNRPCSALLLFRRKLRTRRHFSHLFPIFWDLIGRKWRNDGRRTKGAPNTIR